MRKNSTRCTAKTADGDRCSREGTERVVVGVECSNCGQQKDKHSYNLYCRTKTALGNFYHATHEYAMRCYQHAD